MKLSKSGEISSNDSKEDMYLSVESEDKDIDNRFLQEHVENEINDTGYFISDEKIYVPSFDSSEENSEKMFKLHPEDLHDNENGIKILVFGDPHAKINNLKQFIPFRKKSIKLAKKINPRFIVVLGDTMNDHDIIKGYAYNEAIIFLKELKKIAYTYVLIGNHDMYQQTDFMNEDHCFLALKEWSRLEIVDSTITDFFGQFKFTFVPFVPNGRFLEALDRSDNWRDSDIIFAHQDFDGHSLSQYTDGDTWKEKELVVSGHIHGYQSILGNKVKNIGEIIYPGIPFPQNYIDGSDCSISLFTFDINKNMTHERLKIPGIKQRKKIRIDADDLEDFRIPKNTILKIEIYGTKESINMAKMTKIHKKIKSLESEGFMITYDVLEHIHEFNECKISKRSFRRDLISCLTDEEKIEFRKMFPR